MELKAVKRIRLTGTSLTVNITKEARMMGMDIGDDVEIVLKTVSDREEKE